MAGDAGGGLARSRLILQARCQGASTRPPHSRSQNRPFASVLAKGAKSKFLADVPAPVRATPLTLRPPVPTNVPSHPPPGKRQPTWRMVAGAVGGVAGVLLLAGTPFRGVFGLVRKAQADRSLDRVLKVERAETAEMLGKRYVLDLDEEMRKFRAGKAVPPPEKRRPDDLAAEAAGSDEQNAAP